MRFVNAVLCDVRSVKRPIGDACYVSMLCNGMMRCSAVKDNTLLQPPSLFIHGAHMPTPASKGRSLRRAASELFGESVSAMPVTARPFQLRL